MPVDERTFVADVAGWVTAILKRRTDLPYEYALVEEHGVGGRKRHDFVLYRRGARRVALTGEVKMPDTLQGRSAFHQELVEDAFEKASHAGTRHYFTWNVRDFVLFETHREGVPFTDRRVEGPIRVAEVASSDEVQQPTVEAAIKAFWERLLEELAAIEAGRRPLRNLPLDRRFVLRIEAAMEEPIANTRQELARRYQSDSGFRDELTHWMVSEQGWEDSSSPGVFNENLDRAARLSCYVLVTRLVFYEVLRRRFPVLASLVGMAPRDPEELSQILDSRFEEAVKYSRDYETIFTPRDFGTGLPMLAPEAHKLWRSVVERIEEFDFSRLDFDVIGQLYEQLIGPSERRRYGQFYTSPDVVDLINAFCIRSPETRVLDPACGGGTFLVRAYARKRALAHRKGETPTHQRLLGDIFGVDSATFPAQLASINLAVREISDQPNYPRVVREDFFNVRKGRPASRLPTADGGMEDVALADIDAVVGNPPYIRQEHLPKDYKDGLAELFTTEWPGQASPSGRSDIYVHFFTHGGHFLKPGGHLSFITSIGWLDTEYGFRLQEFFLNNFCIVAVIESQVEKWFEDARVTTAVAILQREPDRIRRMANPVRFIQLRRPLADIYTAALKGPVSQEDEVSRQADMDAVRDLIEEITANQVTDYWRVRVVSQGTLWEQGCRLRLDEDESAGPSQYKGGKWGQYVRAPDVWFDILDRAGSSMVPLQELADIKRGFTSGKDAFFCVRDVTDEQLGRLRDHAEFQKRWGITPADTKRIRIVRDGEGGLHLVEARYLEPEFHTLMEAQSSVVRASDAKRLVINAPVSRASLRRTHLGRYVDFAERQGWHTGSTVASRARSRPWYDLGLRPKEERAHMFWPKAQQYRHLVPWNQDRLPCKDRLYAVWASGSVDPKLLWAVLNSSVVVLAKHVFGRPAGIEGNLDTHVVDVNAMLVPDVRTASAEVANRAVAAAERMAGRLTSRYLFEEFSLGSAGAGQRRPGDDGNPQPSG